MRTRFFLAATLALSTTMAACQSPSARGPIENSSRNRNSTIAHCLDTSLSFDPLGLSPVTTSVSVCADADHVLFSGPSGDGFQKGGQGVILPGFFPMDANGSMDHADVVAFDAKGEEIEWMQLTRTTDTELTKTWWTRTAITAPELTCVSPGLTGDYKKFLPELTCNKVSSISSYDNGSNVNLRSMEMGKFLPVDEPAWKDEVTAVVHGDSRQPLEAASYKIDDNAGTRTFNIKVRVWKYVKSEEEVVNYPAVLPVADGTGGSTDSTLAPTDSTPVSTDSTLSPTDSAPVSTDSTLSPANSSVSESTIADTTPSTDAPASTDGPTTTAARSDLETAADALNRECTAFDVLMTPQPPDELKGRVNFTARIECPAITLPGYTLTAGVLLRYKKTGKATIGLIGPGESWKPYLTGGDWEMEAGLLLLSDETFGLNGTTVAMLEPRTFTVADSETESNDCDGSDYVLTGSVLTSECLAANDTPAAAVVVPVKNGPNQTVRYSLNGKLNLPLSPGMNLIIVFPIADLVSSEMKNAQLLFACLGPCGALPDEIPGLDFTVKDGRYTATWTELCEDGGAFIWMRKLAPNLYSLNFSKLLEKQLINDPGLDSSTSGTAEDGSPIKGSVYSGLPPKYGNVFTAVSYCDDNKMSLSMHEVEVTEKPVVQKSTSAPEKDVVVPTVETPTKSLLGQPVTIEDTTSALSLGGLQLLMAPDIISATASVDGGSPVPFSAFGTSRLPVTKDSKVLTVTYKTRSGKDIVVKKPIVTPATFEEITSPSGSSSFPVVPVLIAVLVLLVLAGVALNKRRTGTSN